MGPTRKRNGLFDPSTVTRKRLSRYYLDDLLSNINIYQPERYTVNTEAVILSVNVNFEEIKYVMSCWVILCNAMLCYIMLCYARLCYVMLYYVMLCYVMLCYVMLCCYAMLCYVVMLCYVMFCYHKVIKSNRKFQTFWLMRNKKKHRNELEYNHWLHLQPDEKIQIRNIKVVASQSRLKFSIY